MAIQINQLADDKLLEVSLTGKLTKEDYEQFVAVADRLIRQHGKLHLLVEMRDFEGCTAGALWEDTKFVLTHFRDIDRLAVVGEEKWQKGLEPFFRSFTDAEVRYFSNADAPAARYWVASD